MSAIVVDVTTRCNFKCGHCLRDKNRSDQCVDIDLDLLDKLYNEGRKSDLSHISLSGGEPILHTKFYDIIDNIVGNNYTFNFVTNGFLYREYEDVVKYRDHLSEAIISIDGATQEVYGLMRDSKGFDRAWDAVKFFSDKKIKVRVQTCLSIFNYPQIEKIIDMAASNGAYEIAFGNVTGSDIQLTKEQCYSSWNIINENSGKIRCYALSNLGIGLLSSCVALTRTSGPRLSPDGYFYSCCDLRENSGLVGNLRCNSYSELKTKAMVANGILTSLHVKYFMLSKLDDRYNTCDFCQKHWNEAIEMTNLIYN